MKADIKAHWLEALRSGDYKKGLYNLKSLDERFDVTGVLCELAVAHGVIPAAVRKEGDKHIFQGYVYGKHNVGLPDEVCEWAGIDYRQAYSTAIRCDSMRNFNDCANYIEERF